MVKYIIKNKEVTGTTDYFSGFVYSGYLTDGITKPGLTLTYTSELSDAIMYDTEDDCSSILKMITDIMEISGVTFPVENYEILKINVEEKTKVVVIGYDYSEATTA